MYRDIHDAMAIIIASWLCTAMSRERKCLGMVGKDFGFNSWVYLENLIVIVVRSWKLSWRHSCVLRCAEEMFGIGRGAEILY